jgi:hypothetical protein
MRNLTSIVALARDINEKLNGTRSVRTIGVARKLIRRALVIDGCLRQGLDDDLFPPSLVFPAAEILYSDEDVDSCGADAANEPEEELTELEGDTIWSQD